MPHTPGRTFSPELGGSLESVPIYDLIPYQWGGRDEGSQRRSCVASVLAKRSRASRVEVNAKESIRAYLLQRFCIHMIAQVSSLQYEYLAMDSISPSSLYLSNL